MLTFDPKERLDTERLQQQQQQHQQHFEQHFELPEEMHLNEMQRMEEKLKQQRLDSEADSRWLASSEQVLVSQDLNTLLFLRVPY